MIVLKRLMLFFIVRLVVREASFRTFDISGVIVYGLPMYGFFQQDSFVCCVKKVRNLIE